jgi:hypothetical protein
MFSLLGVVVFVLDLIAIISLLGGRGAVGHKAFWVVMILFLPLVGLLLYYLLGRSPVDA